MNINLRRYFMSSISSLFEELLKIIYCFAGEDRANKVRHIDKINELIQKLEETKKFIEKNY